MPVLNPGPGLEEHRRFRSPEKPPFRGRILLEEPSPLLLQSRSQRVQPPNENNMRHHPHAEDPSPDKMQFPRRDSALNEDSEVPPAPTRATHKDTSSKSIMFQRRHRDKYPEDFEDLIYANRSPHSESGGGCKLPTSPEHTAGEESEEGTETSNTAREVAISPYPYNRKQKQNKSSSPGGRYPQLPSSKSDGGSDNKNAIFAGKGLSYGGDVKRTVSFEDETERTPSQSLTFSPARTMSTDDYLATREFMIHEHLKAAPPQKMAKKEPQSEKKVLRSVKREPQSVKPELQAVEKEPQWTIADVEAMIGIKIERPAQLPQTVQPAQPENPRKVQHWLENVDPQEVKSSTSKMRDLKITIPPITSAAVAHNSWANFPPDRAKAAHLYCGLGGCKEYFIDSEELKKHYYYEHADSYCEQCKLGFDNFDQLIAHKLDSDAHIPCPKCGLDFKSQEGRDRHIAHAHPKENKVECPGCGDIFKSPGSMIAHVENGKCSILSPQQFIKLRVYATLHATKPGHGQSKKDEENAKVLAIERSFGSIETWIRLAGGSRKQQSINADPPHLRVIAARARAMSKGKEKAVDDKLTLPPELPSAVITLAKLEQLERAQAASESGSQRGSPSAAPVTTRSLQYLSHAQLLETRRLVRFMWGGSPLINAMDTYDTGCNGTPETNPFVEEFNPDRFRINENTVRCPLKTCGCLFHTGVELQNHMIQEMHMTWKIRCPECHKEYDQASKLIDHFQSGANRCQVRKKHWFPRIMEVAASGLVVYDRGGQSGPVFKGKAPMHLLW